MATAFIFCKKFMRRFESEKLDGTFSDDAADTGSA